MTKKPELSIVLPVFNEGENIEDQIRELQKRVKVIFEILIIYDFSGDDTVPVVKRLQKNNHSLLLVKNKYGRGVINAIKTGVESSKSEFLVIMPADLADDPETINKMFYKMKSGYDIVCATRYSKGGKKIGGGFLKTNLSRLAGILTPVLLGINTTDISNGFKMYKRSIFNEIEIESDGGWEFSTEVTIKANSKGYRIGEVATIWKDRVSGKSKFKLLKWLPKYLRWYLWGAKKRLLPF